MFGLLLPISDSERHRADQGIALWSPSEGTISGQLASEFTKAVAGDGIGITTNDSRRPLRIPRNAENKHFLIVGDTGSGKSSIIRQMLYQVDARGDSAIVYDPACEFVKQFYDRPSRRHRAQSTRCSDAVLEPVERAPPQGRSQGSGRLSVSAGRGVEPVLCGGSAEDFRPPFDLSADAGGARVSGCPILLKSTAA